MGIGNHQSAAAASCDWITPQWVLEELGPFQTDPCAHPTQPWPTAERMIAPPEDGLAAVLEGRVWLNPPYESRQMRDWIERMNAHNQGTALVFARTDTQWWHDAAESCTAMLFLRRRVRFCRPDGTPGKYTGGAPSVLIAWGPIDAQRLWHSELPGHFMIPLQPLTKHPRNRRAP